MVLGVSGRVSRRAGSRKGKLAIQLMAIEMFSARIALAAAFMFALELLFGVRLHHAPALLGRPRGACVEHGLNDVGTFRYVVG